MKTSVSLTNVQSRFASVVCQLFLTVPSAPSVPHLMVSFFSIAPEAMHEARLRALEVCRLKKSFLSVQEKEEVVTGRKGIVSVVLTLGHRQANQLFLSELSNI